MLPDPMTLCRVLVGLPDVDVLNVTDATEVSPMVVEVASILDRPGCRACGTGATVHETRRRRLVDMTSYGRRTVLVWRQIRWACLTSSCPVRTWMQVDSRIVVGNRGITDRAARWACEQVGRHGRSVSEVAADLGADWHTVNRAVVAYGTALVDDPDRIGQVAVLGLDETAFVRRGRFRRRVWSTQLVGDGQLLDVVEGRDAAPACAWLADRPRPWVDAISHVTLDLSGTYRKVADTMLPAAVQVADPFHVVRSPTSVSTRPADAFNRRCWAIGAARPIRCIGSASC